MLIFGFVAELIVGFAATLVFASVFGFAVWIHNRAVEFGFVAMSVFGFVAGLIFGFAVWIRCCVVEIFVCRIGGGEVAMSLKTAARTELPCY